MGMIADKANPKQGKLKPYIIWAAIPIATLTILMYLSPDLPKSSLMVYSAIVYVLWGMCYTVADVPFWSLPNIMTPNSTERSSVISFTKIFNSVGSALPEVFFFIAGFLLPKFISTDDPIAYNKKKYLIITVAVVAIGMIFYVNSYFHIKERVHISPKKRKQGDQSTLSLLLRCKPLM